METNGVREEQHLWGVCQDRFSSFLSSLFLGQSSSQKLTAWDRPMSTEVIKPDEKSPVSHH